MSSVIAIPLSIVLAYLIGSVSFGILVSSARGVDIRSEGSGNPGTSNILRVLGKKEALVVLLGDGLKGAFAAWIGVAFGGPVVGYLAVFAAVVGHTFPIWHGFRGGKSVATTIGGIIFLAPGVGATLAVMWIGMVAVWKTASIASITVMLLLVPALWLTGRTIGELFWGAVIAAFVLVRHSGNIRRLIASSERKVTS